MKVLILTILFLLSGCAGLTPEQREYLGAGGFLIGNTWANVAREQAAINDYWTNWQFQQQQLYQMQQQNQILQQMRRH